MILFRKDKINFHLDMLLEGAVMTDSVKGISGAQGPSAGGSYSGGTSPDHHKRRSVVVPPQNDLVEISPDARKRAQGNAKKSLVEYLKELLG